MDCVSHSTSDSLSSTLSLLTSSYFELEINEEKQEMKKRCFFWWKKVPDIVFEHWWKISFFWFLTWIRFWLLTISRPKRVDQNNFIISFNFKFNSWSYHLWWPCNLWLLTQIKKFFRQPIWLNGSNNKQYSKVSTDILDRKSFKVELDFLFIDENIYTRARYQCLMSCWIQTVQDRRESEREMNDWRRRA